VRIDGGDGVGASVDRLQGDHAVWHRRAEAPMAADAGDEHAFGVLPVGAERRMRCGRTGDAVPGVGGWAALYSEWRKEVVHERSDLGVVHGDGEAADGGSEDG